MSLEEIRAENPRRILIVRQHNQMGDMLCAVPSFRAIKECFPQARTMILTAPVNHGVVAGNPYLDEVLLFDKVEVRHSPRAAVSFLRELRVFRPDLAIVLNSVSYSGTSSWLAVFSGASRIIGGDSRPFGWSFSEWLYNLVMPSDPEVTGHAIDHGLAPLRAVGITTDDRSTVLRPGAREQEEARCFLESVGPHPVLAIHPGAGKRENRWPAERFAKLAQRFRDRGWSVWMVEGPADLEASQATQDALQGPLPVLREVSVATVGAALQASDLALVNDTGVMHVAGAVGVPTLALFGPTQSSSWKPPGERVIALQSPDGRMESLLEQEVFDALLVLNPSTSRDSPSPR